MRINYEKLFLHLSINNISFHSGNDLLLFIGCGEIEVTSDLEVQKCRTGIYKIQQQVLNQKPVFKHETKEEYLFYMKKGKGFWMVRESFTPYYFNCTI